MESMAQNGGRYRAFSVSEPQNDANCNTNRRRNSSCQQRWQMLLQEIRHHQHKKVSFRTLVQQAVKNNSILNATDQSYQGEDNTITPTLLHTYLGYMSNLGLTRCNLCDYSQIPSITVKLKLKKIFFWIFSSFAVCYSIDNMKFNVIQFLHNGRLHDYVQLGFRFIFCITQVYLVILHGNCYHNLENLSKHLNMAGFGKTLNSKLRKLPSITGGLSLILATATSIFGDKPFADWSMRAMFLNRSYQMSHTLFIWSASNYKNFTAKLRQDYATEISFTEVALAIPEFVWAIYGSLQELILGDLILISALSLHLSLCHYESLLKLIPASTATYGDFRTKWKQYQIIALASDALHEALGTLLVLYHVYNLLQLAVFLRYILLKNAAHFLFVTTTFNVIKSMITYFIASKVSEKNEFCQTWIRLCAFKSLTVEPDPKMYMEAVLVLDDMKANPLGLGRDELFVNKGFLITFLGMGASLFVMLTDDSQNSTCTSASVKMN